MWVLLLIIFVLFSVAGAWMFYASRKRKQSSEPEAETAPERPADCCGQHAVCERDSLLNKGTEITYYDDEELDALAGVSPDDFTPEQVQQLEYVFRTLLEKDVAGWLRSLQARNIQLPLYLREEALFIVSERRNQ